MLPLCHRGPILLFNPGTDFSASEFNDFSEPWQKSAESCVRASAILVLDVCSSELSLESLTTLELCVTIFDLRGLAMGTLHHLTMKLASLS